MQERENRRECSLPHFLPYSLLYASAILPPSLPLSFVLLPSLLPYIVLAIKPIHRRLLFFDKWRWSRLAGGKEGIEAEWIQKGLLSLSLFILLPRVSIPSLSLSSSACVSGDCSESWGACWTLCLCDAFCLLQAYANRIINLAPDYIASLTHLHLPVLRTLSLLCQPIEWRPWLAKYRDPAVEEKPARGLWNKDVLGARVYSTCSALRV